MRKQSKAFNWKGAQGELVQMMIAEGKIPPNPTKTQYKAVYDASEGDVLKFQNFHSSWKNVSRNLAASGAVLGSTGLRQSAANDQMGDRGVAEASVDCLVAPEVAFRKKNKKGVLEASRDLYWPTFHSYWHDKHDNLHLHFLLFFPQVAMQRISRSRFQTERRPALSTSGPTFCLTLSDSLRVSVPEVVELSPMPQVPSQLDSLQ